MESGRKNKKKRGARIVGWAIIIIFFSIVVPLAINWVYKLPATIPAFAVDWEAKDALQFYGSLLSAAATIFVLRETIVFTRDNQKEERRLSIKPYLETHKYNYTEIQDIPNDNVVFLNINKSIITYQGDFPDDIADIVALQKRILVHETIETIDQTVLDYSLETFFKKKYVILYEIENCGAGNAIDIGLQIGDMSPIQKFCITISSPKKFVFILNDDLLVNDRYELNICITYSDIASLGKYCQEESFLFERNSAGELQTVQFEKDLLTEPKEL